MRIIGGAVLTTACLLLSACGGPGDPASATCSDLGTRAVQVSKDEGLSPRLSKVRDPLVLTDHRKTYRKPAGTGESLVLECVGGGVYSSGTAKTYMRLLVDADGDQVVRYKQAVGPYGLPPKW